MKDEKLKYTSQRTKYPAGKRFHKYTQEKCRRL